MVEKYRKITFNILLIVPFLFSLFYIDIWILPQKSVADTIVAYSEKSISRKGRYSSSRSELMACWKFYTQKGHEFSTEKRIVDENNVTIKYSYIFNIVTSVKSKNVDYSDKLVSGLNSLNLLLTMCLLISTIIGLLLLKYYTNLSLNGFYNIVLLNSFLAIILLYFLYFQN